jgi:hypothetical protein
VLIDNIIVPGTRALTLAGVQDDVRKGGRFVIYSYVFSVLIMTFRKNSGIYYVRSDSDGVSKALGFSVLSMLLGPWGIPWGLIWTPAAVFTNLAGGTDVTAPVLGALLGEQEAGATMSQRRKRSAGWPLMLLRTFFITAPIALVAMLFVDSEKAAADERKTQTSPGFAAFTAAHDRTSGPMTGGNTGEAKDAAKGMAEGMKRFLDEATKDVARDYKASHYCGVWCEIRPGRCMVIMRVPDLEHYNDDSKKVLADAAWADALANLQGLYGIKPGNALHVGLRGDVRYSSVMSGTLTSDLDAKPKTRYGSDGKKKMVEWFTPELETPSLSAVKPSSP